MNRLPLFMLAFLLALAACGKPTPATSAIHADDTVLDAAIDVVSDTHAVTDGPDLGTEDSTTRLIFFSADGSKIRTFSTNEIKTYDARTSVLEFTDSMSKDAALLTVSSSGRYGLFRINNQGVLFDAEKRSRTILRALDGVVVWGNADSENQTFSMSDDGKVLAVESGWNVQLIDLSAQTLVGKRSRELGAGGVFSARVSSDGKFLFFEHNRSATSVVLDWRANKEVFTMNYIAQRSPDGRWIVDYPFFGHLSPPAGGAKITVKDGTSGRTIDHLKLAITDKEAGSMNTSQGAFCGEGSLFVLLAKGVLHQFRFPAMTPVHSRPLVLGAAENEKPATPIACSPSGDLVAFVHQAKLMIVKTH